MSRRHPVPFPFACAQAALWSHAVRRCDARKGYSGALTWGNMSTHMGHAVRRHDARAFFVGRSTPALDVGGMATVGMAPLTTLVSLALVVLAAAHGLHQPIPPPLPPAAHPTPSRKHTDTCALSRTHALPHARTHARTHTPTAPVRPHTVITYVLQICRASTAHIPKAVGSTWRPMSSESFAAAVCLGKPKHSASSKRVRETSRTWMRSRDTSTLRSRKSRRPTLGSKLNSARREIHRCRHTMQTRNKRSLSPASGLEEPRKGVPTQASCPCDILQPTQVSLASFAKPEKQNQRSKTREANPELP